LGLGNCGKEWRMTKNSPALAHANWRVEPTDSISAGNSAA
jgi:hypothetical protein